MSDTGPRTEAGRAFLARLFRLTEAPESFIEAILAIEAEARAGHAECEANMDGEIERLTRELAEARADVDGLVALPTFEQIAEALNLYENETQFDPWPPGEMLGTHHVGCMHVGRIHDHLADLVAEDKAESKADQLYASFDAIEQRLAGDKAEAPE